MATMIFDSSVTPQIDSVSIPTTSGGTEHSTGTAGQVLKTNGSTVYWDSAGDAQSQIYYIKGNADATAGVWTGTDSRITEYFEGLTVVFVPQKAGATTTTLNINGLGAKTCYYNGTTKLTTQYAVGTPIIFTYYSNSWRTAEYDTNSNTVPSGYCPTAAATAAKTVTCTYYTATNYSYLHIVIRYANTAASAITLNVNSQGAKPIYINGVASSTTNYTLPAGTYITYYDGTNYYFRTDGKLPALLPITVEDDTLVIG